MILELLKIDSIMNGSLTSDFSMIEEFTDERVFNYSSCCLYNKMFIGDE